MKPPLFVDQEVGSSIPPNRTNLFNGLAEFRDWQSTSQSSNSHQIFDLKPLISAD